MRHVRRLLAEGLVVLLVTALSMAIVRWVPFIAVMENWLSDYRIASLSKPQPQSSDIVIATLTDDTVRMFPYRTPLDRHFLAGLLKLLDDDGARAIGVDVLLDQATEPAKDDELRATIRGLRAPLIIGFVNSDQGLDEDELEYLADFIPLEHRGFVNLIKDSYDATVRSMYPGNIGPEGSFIPGFPLAIAKQVEPQRDFAAQTIDWRAGPNRSTPPFAKYPAHALKLMPPALIKGKIVLVGADLTLTDRHRTPLATIESGRLLLPGIEIHAHALDQLLNGRTAAGLGLPARLALVLAVSLLGAVLAQLGLRLIVTLALVAAIIAALWLAGFKLFQLYDVMIPLLLPTMALVGTWWISGVQQNWRERRQKQFLKDAFSRYMSSELVNQLVADPDKLVLGGERREMSFLFTDVAGFTTLSETIEAGLLGSLLNSYFNGLCSIIMAEGGTVIDFVGDAVFAIFGAPIAQTDHAVRAINCARKIQQFASEFRESGEAKSWNWGNTRIGVHSGFALVGNFGADMKFKYAPVGDAVNTASRIEGLNKFFGTTTCLSESTVEASDFKAVRPLGRCVMKGKSVPLAMFEPVDDGWSQTETGQLYLAAYQAMAEERNTDALSGFEKVLALTPGDGCSEMHLERLRSGDTGDLVILKDK